MSAVTIRPLRVADFEIIEEMQLVSFPAPLPAWTWSEEDIAACIEHFPEGQFVAEMDGQVVGSAMNMIASEDAWQQRLGWWEIAGGAQLQNHDPSGTTLYGLESQVNVDYRRQGVARALYNSRFDLVRKLNLARFGTGCRIPDLRLHPTMQPEAYAEAVVRGELTDPTLTAFLHLGMTYRGVIHNYMPDPESNDCAALLEWNP